MKTQKQLEQKFHWSDNGAKGRVDDATDAIYMFTQWLNIMEKKEGSIEPESTVFFKLNGGLSLALQIAALEHIAELRSIWIRYQAPRFWHFFANMQLDRARHKIKKTLLETGVIDAKDPLVLTGRISRYKPPLGKVWQVIFGWTLLLAVGGAAGLAIRFIINFFN